MKKKLMYLFCIICFLLPITSIQAFHNLDNSNLDTTKADNSKILLFKGHVSDWSNDKALSFASIFLSTSGISNISNGEGYFTFKIPMYAYDDTLCFSYLGYKTSKIYLKGLVDEFLMNSEKNKSSNNNSDKSDVITIDLGDISLAPIALELSASIIRPEDPAFIVQSAINKIPDNYTQERMHMKAFYREMIKKGNHYVTLTEAALNISKQPYSPYSMADQCAIYKGRSSVDWEKIDSIFVKFRGGITSSLESDIMKSPFLAVDPRYITDYYNFTFATPVEIDGRTQYVINITQKEHIQQILFSGKLYIDMESLALTRADLSLNCDVNKQKATALFISKKPRKMRTEIEYATYQIRYREFEGKWLFDYVRTEFKFKSRWKSQWFYRHYTITSEMASTDINSEEVKIPRKLRINHGDITLDKVQDFRDDTFWKDYNIIEPETDIQKVIRKVIKRLD
ncbi:MAG: carboxypeptidase-like regulatory domain-containing protein [Bacteroidales bacterium]